MKTKLLAAVCAAALLSSCQDLTVLSAYGDLHATRGKVTFTPPSNQTTIQYDK